MAESSSLTYADLEEFPDDNIRREIIDGELFVSPSPRTRHQEIALRLAVAFHVHVSKHGGGRVLPAPFDVVLSESNVVEPDLVFIAADQAEILNDRNASGAPALLIEVLSDPRRDRVRKRDLYARFGVGEYWLVDPDADRIEVYRLGAKGYGKPDILEPGETLTYDKLPGLLLDLSALFAPR